MGNNQSTIPDHNPEQLSDQGMREFGIPLDQQIPIKEHFFIEGKKLNNRIYGFQLYHLDKIGFSTKFFTFKTCHPLRNEFKVMYDGSIVNFVFQTDSFEKGLNHVFEYSFNFSKLFHSEKEFSNPLKSTPFLLPLNRKITNLHENYWYYWITVDATHYELYIVESSDKSQLGFESTFKTGDVVIQKINVESLNFPSVMNDEQGNLVIASADEGFEPIPIRLPSDELTLTQALGQETFQ